MRLGVLTLLASALACKGGDRDPPGAPAAPAGSGSAAGATATAPGEPRGNRAAEPEGPTGEIFHATDRRSTQGFGRGDLAVGGGWVYWIERPRIDHDGKAVVRRKAASAPAAGTPAAGAPAAGAAAAAKPPIEPETVAGPGRIHAIAADAERLYVAGDALESRPHAGGTPSPVAAGAWLEIVPGDKHLLIRSREQVALVPKASGAVETVWEGKHSKLAVAADGDRFIAIPVSPWAQKSAARAITAYAPGAKPAVIAELAEARGDLAVDGDWIYFSGETGAARSSPPLWRIPRAGGTPERVGDPTWGFGEFVIRKGTLYGMVFTGAWKLQKLALSPGAVPVALEGRVPSMIQALATDDAHLYYLTDFEVKRAPR